MIITFVGHATVAEADRVGRLVKEEIRKYMAKGQGITCYLGGYGDFDEISARACRALKAEGGGLELVYVTPYRTLAEQEKIRASCACGLYDATVYPPLECVPPRLAILRRNAWMVRAADLVIAYVRYTHGGAYRALREAVRQKKEIVNLYAPPT